ncbi:hypothetical protein KGF56_003223 [Candida oxycetoniae]|uniref:Glutaredoxin-like protein n=1 Tax=Candida oxycetoniae TaxID=497107 RepID=A0AAI9SVP8_9ASCO|nr:uncharacterized protein KGF56_003223 [Candida oxycetoniae]KAI3403956.1 hypothetical protein KGF56_003223 [Candida oxycetoniae]
MSLIRQFSRHLYASSCVRGPAAFSLTFFTKDNCKLCSDAKMVLEKSLKSPTLKNANFIIKNVDIQALENREWFDKYCYDVPVLHIEKPGAKLKKFMHYLHEDDIIRELRSEQ